MPDPFDKYENVITDPFDKYEIKDKSEIPGPVAQFLQKYGPEYIQPTLQAGGAALGGIAGSALGPLGTVGGAGAGYAGGEQLYRIAKELAGMKEAKTPAEELKQFGQKALEGATAEMAGAGLGTALGGTVKALPGIAKKLGKSVYAVPENAISYAAKNPMKMEQAITETPETAGKRLLAEMNAAKTSKVTAANAGLNRTLKAATEQGKTIDIKPVMEQFVDTLNKYEEIGAGKEYIKETEQAIYDLMQLQAKYGDNIPLDRANEIKRLLQDSAFYQEGAFKVYRNDPVAKAYTKAANALKTAIETEAPKVKKYNKELSEVLQFESNPKFKNAFSEQNIESTMKNLQSETGNKSFVRDLAKKADKALGTAIEEETKAQHAAKYFRSPDVISGYFTGRSPYISALGGTVGGAIGGVPGAAVGAAGGAALSSPMALKAITPKAMALQKLLEQIAGSGMVQTETKALPYQINQLLEQ